MLLNLSIQIHHWTWSINMIQHNLFLPPPWYIFFTFPPRSHTCPVFPTSQVLLLFSFLHSPFLFTLNSSCCATPGSVFVLHFPVYTHILGSLFNSQDFIQFLCAKFVSTILYPFPNSRYIRHVLDLFAGFIDIPNQTFLLQNYNCYEKKRIWVRRTWSEMWGAGGDVLLCWLGVWQLTLMSQWWILQADSVLFRNTAVERRGKNYHLLGMYILGKNLFSNYIKNYLQNW